MYQCVYFMCVCVDANQQERQGGARSAVLMRQQQRTRSDASGRAFSTDLADLALKLLEQQLVRPFRAWVISSQDSLQLRTNWTCQPHLQKQLQVFDLLLQFCHFSSDAMEQHLYTSSMKNMLEPRSYLFQKVSKFLQVFTWKMCTTLEIVGLTCSPKKYNFDSIYFWSLDKKLSRCWRPVRFRWAASSCLSCQWRDSFQTNSATRNTSYVQLYIYNYAMQEPWPLKWFAFLLCKSWYYPEPLRRSRTIPNVGERLQWLRLQDRDLFNLSWAAIMSSWTRLKCDISPDGPQKRAAPVKVFCSMPPVGSSVVEPGHCGPEQWL